MAMGARKAIQDKLATEASARWLRCPFLGCDGLPLTGQVWANRGLLAATIIVPSNTGPALEMMLKFLGTGSQPPEHTMTVPVSYPPLEPPIPKTRVVLRQCLGDCAQGCKNVATGKSIWPTVRTSPRAALGCPVLPLDCNAQLRLLHGFVLDRRERNHRSVDIPSVHFQLRMTFEFVRLGIVGNHNTRFVRHQRQIIVFPKNR